MNMSFENKIKGILKEDVFILKRLSDVNLQHLNDIINSSLKESDKLKSVKIYLKYYYHSYDYEGEIFLRDFLFNEFVNNRKCFSKLLDAIYKGIKAGRYLSKRILTLSRIAKFFSYADDSVFEQIFYQVLSFNMEGNKDDFIQFVLLNVSNPNWIDKFIIIISALEKIEMHDLEFEYGTSYAYIFDTLFNDLTYNLSDSYYKKLAEICFNSQDWHPLYSIICKDNSKVNLTINQLEVIIDYYYEILNKYHKKFNFITFNYLDIIFAEPIFSVVINEEYLKMDVQDYKMILDSIANSKNPLSTAIVYNSQFKRAGYALKYIDSGEELLENKYGDIVFKDVKEPIANFATSKLAQLLNDRCYKKIIDYLDKNINKYAGVQKKNAGYEDKQANIAYHISKVFNDIFDDRIYYDLSFYEEQKHKLYFVLDEIINSHDIDYIWAVGKIAKNPIIKNYSLNEFLCVLRKIRESSNKSELVQYFTNENLPYIEDKNSFIDSLDELDSSSLGKIINNYNKIGLEEKVFRRVIGDKKNIVLAKKK